MTDEDQIRDLLERASQLPAEITPPVGDLIKMGRQERKTRTAQRTLAIGLVAVLAIVIPPVIRAKNSGPLPQHQSARPHGPTGAQLAKYRWSKLPPSPLGPRQEPLLVSAGRYVIELGGIGNNGSANDGAAFDLKTRRWREIAPVEVNVGFDQAVTAWTGRELFVTDGVPANCSPRPNVPGCEPRAGLYDPATNLWSNTLLPTEMFGLHPVAVAWTGRVIELAALNAHRDRLAVGAYNPVTGRWRVITPQLPAQHRPQLIQMVATYNRVILWSEWAGKVEPDGLTNSGIDVFAFTDNGPSPVAPWRNVTGKWPQGVEVGRPFFTGSSILFPPNMQWCVGRCLQDIELHDGFFADPGTLRKITTVPADLADPLGHLIWTGRAIISVFVDDRVPHPVLVNHLDVYDLATRTWRALASPGTHTTAFPVWTGSELLVVTHTGATLALHR
jgi:hypothetical protein